MTRFNNGQVVRFYGYVGERKNYALLKEDGNYKGRVTGTYGNGDVDVMDSRGHQWRVKTES